jgi:hypothetical protein
VQVTITEPYERDSNCQSGLPLGDAGFPGYWAVGGVGVLLQIYGAAWQGAFPRPCALHLASASITRSSIVVVWDGTRFVRAPHGVAGRGSADVPVTANSDIAVLTPTGKRSGPAATTARRAPAASAAHVPAAGPELAAALFLRPANSTLPGIGVLPLAWLRAFAARDRTALARSLPGRLHR